MSESAREGSDGGDDGGGILVEQAATQEVVIIDAGPARDFDLGVLVGTGFLRIMRGFAALATCNLPVI